LNPKAPKSYSRLALAIAAAVLVVGAAIYAASYAGMTTTVTETPTVDETSTVSSSTVCLCPTAPAPCPCASKSESSTSSPSNSSVSCAQSGIHGTLYVRVVDDDGSQSVQGANVTATIIGFCSPDYDHAVALGLTNSTGYAPVGSTWTGNFVVDVTHAGTDYTFPAETSGSVSLVTLDIQSGIAVERTIACYGLGCQNATTTVTASSTSLGPSATVILPMGGTYQVQSSYDCLAGHAAQPFNVTSTSALVGGVSAGQPGVTVYVATAQDSLTTDQGHPTAWLYSSGLTTSTSFSLTMAPGSYVLWTEGADMGCGSSTITPLEQLTTVTVMEAVTLTPDS
jgi:hypothetical protein